MDKAKLQSDIAIDPSALDVEAVRQAELFYDWAEKASEATMVKDKLETAVKLRYSQLSMRCREMPEQFGIAKITEGSVEAVIQTNPEYIALQKQYHEAALEAALLGNAVRAMQQKKDMIEYLGKLHGQQYFAGPNVPRNLIEAWSQHKEKESEALNARQRTIVRKRVRREEV